MYNFQNHFYLRFSSRLSSTFNFLLQTSIFISADIQFFECNQLCVTIFYVNRMKYEKKRGAKEKERNFHFTSALCLASKTFDHSSSSPPSICSWPLPVYNFYSLSTSSQNKKEKKRENRRYGKKTSFLLSFFNAFHCNMVKKLTS